MQIDFHHAVTYVAARAAEFDHPEAEKIAYCAQYVDDAVKTGYGCLFTSFPEMEANRRTKTRIKNLWKGSSAPRTARWPRA